MNRNLYWKLTLALIILLAVVSFAQPVTKVAKLIEVNPLTHHLGNIPDTKSVTCFFSITNNSKQILQLTKIQVPCSCTAAKPKPAEIPPGKQTQVRVSFDPRGRNGYIRWDINVFTNLMSKPLVLSLDATILRDSIVSHKIVTFGEFQREAKIERKIWISPRNYPDFKILEISVQTPHHGECFEVYSHVEPYSGFYPGTRPAHCIRIVPKRDIPFGRIEGYLVVITDIPNHEKLQVPIFARVSGEIGISRDYLTFGIFKKIKSQRRRVMVYHRRGKTFDIQEVKSTLPFLKIFIYTIIPKQYYEIRVIAEVDDKLPNGEFRGKLLITTSSKQQPLITIPIQGFVKK